MIFYFSAKIINYFLAPYSCDAFDHPSVLLRNQDAGSVLFRNQDAEYFIISGQNNCLIFLFYPIS